MKNLIIFAAITLCCLGAAAAEAETYTFRIKNRSMWPVIISCDPVQIKVIYNGTAVVTNSNSFNPNTEQTITTNNASGCTSIELSTSCRSPFMSAFLPADEKSSLNTTCAGGLIVIGSGGIYRVDEKDAWLVR